MRLHRLEIRNYKSLRYRDSRRAKEPISFRVVVEFPTMYTVLYGTEKRSKPSSFTRIDYSFSFKARVGGTPSRPAVIFEPIITSDRGLQGTFQNERRITRDDTETVRHQGWKGSPVETLEESLESEGQEERRESSLILSRVLGRHVRTRFEELMGSLRVFQLDPRSCREAGVPIPNSELDRTGRNLPAVLAHLKKDFLEEYDSVLASARRVMPSLEAIETDWTHTRSLALFLKERGIRRPWTSTDISDGTIQTIALLVAAFDPRTSLVVIEEPENSVHPWALRNLVEAFRKATEEKQILLTTHSPILIDQLKPEEVWVVQKPGTETKIDPLLSLDSSLKESWGQGKFTLSEYLDSGAVPEAVPAVNS
jgi:putative AbiEii toxin of type IV toxin-antitoxin system